MSLLMTPDAMIAPEQWPPADLAIKTKYELDPFQKHAVLGIHAGDHVFVTAKTGSGKTFVGEYLIARCLSRGQRVFYTTPIKSLSNQKYHDLKKLFPQASVGILTGDIKMCPDAQIVVMTAEILRNLFYKRGTATEGVGLTAAVSLEGVGGVVMDEVHYIQDPDRGHVWEETMILCPRFVDGGVGGSGVDTVVPPVVVTPITPPVVGVDTVVGSPSIGVDTVVPPVVTPPVVPPSTVVTPPFQLVLLSATMPSAASLANWLANLHQRRTWLLSTTYRIVPLVHGVLESNNKGSWAVKPLLDSRGQWISESYTGWLRDRKAVADAALAHKKAVDARRRDGYAAPVPSGKVRVEDPIARLLRTVKWLEESSGLPALFFVFSRKECERLTALMVGTLLDTSDAAAATHIIDFHLSRHRAVLEKSPQYHRIRELLVRGIAFHHSGLQPLLKEIVEILFTRGYVKVLFATETFSVGLNMPTKTVIFLELEKWSDGGMKRLLRPDEYIQMAGRAGRRGLDTQGLVLYEPMHQPIDSGELKSMLTGALPPLQSRMRFHYDFILKHRLTGGRVPIAEQSYWAQQQRETRVSLGQELDIMRLRQTSLTSDQIAAFQERDALEADVAASVNAKRKKAQMALTRWIADHDYKNMAQLNTLYAEFKSAQQQQQRLEQDIAEWDASPLLALEPQEQLLCKWGFLSAKMTKSSTPLTPLGLTATEVNEGHMILMPMLSESQKTDVLTAEEMVCVLAVFLQEGKSDNTPPLAVSGLRLEALDVLFWIDGAARRCERDEDALRVHSPSNFWDLSSLWVCVAARWLAGYGLTQIATEFDLFEGNVQRGLMRIANLLEEWGAIATLRSDLATLEKLRALKFMRDEVIVDSLYLRL